MKQFTKKEEETIRFINRANGAASHIYYGMKKDKTVVQTVKNEGENRGQYGYYISSWAGQFYILLKRMGITSVVDLGCGAHIFGNIIQCFSFDSVKFAGYEIEEDLIKDSKSICWNPEVMPKDILKLKTEDLEPYQAVYFWEPLNDPKLAEKFVKNLEKVMPKDRYIFYVCAGSIGSFLDTSKRFTKVENNLYSHIRIYKS